MERWMQEQGIREEDEVKVCELFDQYERRGRAEGEKRGRAMGLAEGEKRGRMQGIIDGEVRFAKLLQMLLEGERNDDVKRVATDQSYRNQLYIEMELV